MQSRSKIAVLIDDNIPDLEIIEGTIKGMDPSVMCISFIHADEAVRVVGKALKQQPDYIFIEMNMKRKTGTACLKELRAMQNLATCRIIIFSIMMPEMVADTFIKMGADFAFQKPASPVAFRQIVNEVLLR